MVTMSGMLLLQFIIVKYSCDKLDAKTPIKRYHHSKNIHWYTISCDVSHSTLIATAWLICCIEVWKEVIIYGQVYNYITRIVFQSIPRITNLAIEFHSNVRKMRDKNTNKGTGFTNEERASLKIRARLPFRVETL